MKNSSKKEQFKELINESTEMVVFTGAGISTESGIPDFRSPGGLWTKFKPIDFGSFMSSEEVRAESWRRKFNIDNTISNAKPNKGHKAIAHLVKKGKVNAVITQNVDNLHQDSGVPMDKVIELHGNTTYAICLSCKKRYEIDEIKKEFLKTEIPPICDECGGIIKTATISFGQSMPEDEMKKAQIVTLNCDLFVAIGSSLQVYPAAGFPILAKKNGSKLIILNRDETDLDGYSDLVINKEIGKFFDEVFNISN
jgi:NAD-dependent deacetylase